MERLESKRVKGHHYYSYSLWARVDNRGRYIWQNNLGKWEDIVAARPWRWTGTDRQM
jgi:hypothetical protein